MTTKKTLRLLKKMGGLMQQLTNIKETLGKGEFLKIYHRGMLLIFITIAKLKTENFSPIRTSC